jgi:hypothetical protein
METVGEYEFNPREMLGRGGFGVVYRGRHKTVIFDKLSF